MDPPYTQDIGLCRAERTGGGLDDGEYRRALGRVAPALDRLRAEHAAGRLPLLSLPGRTDDLADMRAVADRLGGADRVCVFGTGGSSLGAQTLYQACRNDDAPGLAFFDNVDPDTALVAAPDGGGPPPLCVVISKSGATAETLAQFLVVRARLGEICGPSWPDRVIVITGPGDSPLRRLAAGDGLTILDHEPGLGGRYSVLSNVGLLPFALAGGDPASVRAGAAAVAPGPLEDATPEAFAPAVGAALNLGFQDARGHGAAVLLAYSDRLETFGHWFRQLWAESLGKAGRGTIPVAARGTTDQHSQLQLWLDGPANALFTAVVLDRAGAGPALDGAGDDPDLAYLAGRTLGDLMEAEQRATIDTLAARGRPVRVLHLARLDERALGALMMHFMLETILTGYAMGVDPFDQPAVEEGKRLARAYLSGEPGKR